MKALQAIKGIRHAHLLTVFGVWEKDGYLIVATELADRSLLDRLKEAVKQGQPGIPLQELQDWLRDAARGIDHLNSLGIIHRDVKPHNLFLCGDSVKVADFGLAKMLERTLATASTKLTPAYSAPEFFNSQASRWSDQYCLAVSYCQLRGNRLPFEGGISELVAGHLFREPDLSMLPEPERPVVQRALAKEPSARWSTCREFVEALSAVMAGMAPATGAVTAADTGSTAKMPSPAEPTAPTSSLSLMVPGGRGIRPGWILVFLILVLAGLGILFWEDLWKLVAAPVKPVVNVMPSATAVASNKISSPTPSATQSVEPAPRLTLLEIPEVTVKAGERVETTIRVRRENYRGRIDLRLTGLPTGIKSQPAGLESEQEVVNITLLVERTVAPQDVTVTLEAAAADLRDTRTFRLHVEARRRPDLAKAPFSAATAKQLQREWADYLDLPAELRLDLGKGVALELMLIPPGTYQMGSPTEEMGRYPDEVLHPVTISQPFYLGKFEVTQEQYAQVVGANPSYFAPTGGGKGKVAGDTGQFPVENVSWEEATRYCRQLSTKLGRTVRLPTEAEWEYACRAGTTTPFHFGTALNGTQANCDGRVPYGTAEKGPHLDMPRQVGSFAANPFGLYDMHGNVWEWCADGYDGNFYRTGPATDPINTAERTRLVVRGGSFSNEPTSCRAAYRARYAADFRIGFVGFRVAVEAIPVP
jgi:formylglycine-generating enzyme required for sulfatase activity